MIFVATHDGGCEGQSLPVLAFESRDTALKWAAVQTESYEVTAVPVYPEIPRGPWFRLKAEQNIHASPIQNGAAHREADQPSE